MLRAQEGIPSQEQLLIVAGTLLEDDQLLSERDIKHHSTLYTVLPLSGGSERIHCAEELVDSIVAGNANDDEAGSCRPSKRMEWMC